MWQKGSLGLVKIVPKLKQKHTGSYAGTSGLFNQKINFLDSQDCFMEDQIKCSPGKQIDSPAEGTSLASCMEQLTEEEMLLIVW